MEVVLNVGLGVGLAAACGFRVFLPVLALGLAGRTGFLNLASSFEWITEDAALLTLAVAVVLEIGAYYVPLLNNLLDAIAMPAAVAAGVLVSAANIETASPLLNWSLAAVTGGGAAAVVRSGTTLLRGAVTAFTGGLATPVVSTGENGAAVGFSLLAIIAPLLALAATLMLVAVVVPLGWRAFKRRQARVAAGGGRTDAAAGRG